MEDTVDAKNIIVYFFPPQIPSGVLGRQFFVNARVNKH